MQAKTIRRTFTIVQGEAAKIEAATAEGPRKAALEKQIDEWTKTAARYQSEPEAGGGKGEGTRELMRRALEKEKERDLQFNRYHNFEFASAAFQIGIVLASAAVITGIVALAYGGDVRRPRRRAADGHRLLRAGALAQRAALVRGAVRGRAPLARARLLRRLRLHAAADARDAAEEAAATARA